MCIYNQLGLLLFLLWVYGNQFDSERKVNSELILFRVDLQISQSLPKAGTYTPLTSFLNEQPLKLLLSSYFLYNIYTSTELLPFFVVFLNSFMFAFPGFIPSSTFLPTGFLNFRFLQHITVVFIRLPLVCLRYSYLRLHQQFSISN